MFPPRPTHLLHLLLEDVIQAGDTVIDATAGNGHDTVFLAGKVGAEGRVVAFDIQEQAIASTEDRLNKEDLRDRVSLHLKSHDEMAEIVAGPSVSAIVFNLGYLPGADHDVITETPRTIRALTISTSLLKPKGVLAVVCYPGHPGGDEETSEVEKFIGALENFRTAKYQMISTKQASPLLLIALKTSLV